MAAELVNSSHKTRIPQHPLAAAVRLLAAVDTWRRREGVQGPQRDREAGGRVVAQIRAQLPGGDFEAAQSAGTALTLEQAVAYAREQLSDSPPA